MANIFVTSDTLPLYTVEGKIWRCPLTGQALQYLNGMWRVFAGGGEYAISYNYPLTIFLNGVDITAMVPPTSLKIQNILTSQVDTCDFTLEDYDNSMIIVPGEEIQIWYKQSVGATPELVFAGEITTAPQESTAPGQFSYVYKVQCTDWSKRLKRKVVVAAYTNQLAGDIIKNMVATYLPEFGITSIQDGVTISAITFNYKPLADCIAELAKLTGYDWYVDYTKDIHFFSAGTQNAPYQLTEDEATGHYKELQVKIDKSQLRNKVYVRGGNYLSDLYTYIRSADGVQTAFLLDYPPRTPITVYVDSGAGYVEHTCGIDNVDSSGYDFVVNYTEKLIKNLEHATLSAGHKIKVTFTYDIQVLTVDQDDSSISDVQTIEGGDGIYENVITDTSILTIDAGHARALAELEQYAPLIVQGTFKTDQYGYQAGQTLIINMPERWLANKTYMIQRVVSQLRSDSQFEYTITFATVQTALVQLLAKLIDQGKEIVVRQNETLQELTSSSEPALALTEEESESENAGGVFVWSNDSGTTANKGVWNEFQYS